MKLAIFYPNNMLAGWYSQGGYRNALLKMGHDVLDVPLPGNQPRMVEELKAQGMVPKLEDLLACDMVLSLYHEYTLPWLASIYGYENWRKLMDAVPVVGRLDESMDRPDLGLIGKFKDLQLWAHALSFPAAQDAKKYGGFWHPFGADPAMFNLGESKQLTGQHQFPALFADKKYDVGFIGSMYPMRMDYFKKLLEHMPDKIVFHAGPCVVQDLGGVRQLESTQLLAENYRQIKIFFCLPPMSKLLVAKVFDVMACGTMVMYPRLPGESGENCNLFEDKREIVYYDPGYLKKNVQQIVYYLAHDDERRSIAASGYYRVMKNYTLEQMLDGIIALGNAAKNAMAMAAVQS